MVLLAVFERDQVITSVEKSSLLASIVCDGRDACDDVEPEIYGKILGILEDQQIQHGILNPGFKTPGRNSSQQFTESGLVPSGEVIEINANSQNILSYLFGPVVRLIGRGDQNILIKNAGSLLSETSAGREAGPGSFQPLIDHVLLDRRHLKSRMLEFMSVYFLQATILLLLVVVPVYVIAKRRIGVPARELSGFLQTIRDNPMASAGAVFEQQSTIREIAMGQEAANELSSKLHAMGLEVFRDYRGKVEHDINGELSRMSSYIRLVPGIDEPAVRSLFVELLEEKLSNTRKYLEDIFIFMKWGRSNAEWEEIDLGGFCADLLCTHFDLDADDAVLEMATDVQPIVELRKELSSLRNEASFRHVFVARACVDVPDGLVMHSNRAALTSALNNLIWNSTKIFRAGDFADGWQKNVVEVGARRMNGDVEIWVRDNGPGFGRLKPDRTGAQQDPLAGIKGWGLGIEIVRERCNQLGGGMLIADQPRSPHGARRAGAEVILKLPLDGGNIASGPVRAGRDR